MATATRIRERYFECDGCGAYLVGSDLDPAMLQRMDDDDEAGYHSGCGGDIRWEFRFDPR